jgi:DNA-binding NarL/FixJ family response regulator
MTIQSDSFARRRVLLVEDEAMSRTLLGDVLTAEGFEVEACATAKEALYAVKVFDPDAIITDIDLGQGPTGLDFVVAVTKIAPYVAIVILSNYAITPDYRHAGLGSATYVNKQDLSDSRVLLDALEDALHDVMPRDQETAGLSERLAGLTPPQVQVLRMIAEGLSNEEIARRRETSVKSVEHMISRIFAALELTPDGSTNLRVAAVRIYIEEAGLPGHPA